MILVLIGIGLILASGLVPARLIRAPATRDRLTRFLLVAGCGVGLIPALGLLASAPEVVGSESGSPIGAGPFGLDRLSAWFVVVVLAVGGASGSYGVSYPPARSAGTCGQRCTTRMRPRRSRGW
jgi:formate hydrogenlyase subunit 3/multisubunit Na+/H+ antiporter MnhD subunit